MSISQFFIDWISVVFKYDFLPRHNGGVIITPDVDRAMSRYGFGDGWSPCKPRFGYQAAWRQQTTGAVVQTCFGREEMGVNYIATGDPLRIMGWMSVLSACCNNMGRFTRVDFSIDVIDPLFDMDTLYRDIAQERVITRARRHSMVTSSTGCTIYVGSRSAEKFLRVYDKGAEQDEQPDRHFRIELEAKGGVANLAAYVVWNTPDYDVREVIMGFFDAPEHPGWMRAMEGVEAKNNIQSDKKRPNTEAWLLEFIIPQIGRAVERDPDFLERFLSDLHAYILD